MKLEERLEHLEKRVFKLELQQDRPGDDLPSLRDQPWKTGTGAGSYSSGAVGYNTPPRRPSIYDQPESYQRMPSPSKSLDLQVLNAAVCRFLVEEPGGWEIERLVQSVRGSMDDNASIDVEHLVPHSSGEWRLVALWPQRSQEGLVLVSSGELVDNDIAKYFEVSFGRRIIACKQPARVSRGGDEVSVLQKGRVESS